MNSQNQSLQPAAPYAQAISTGSMLAPVAHAQRPGLVSNPLPNGGQSWSLPVQTLVFITALTFIPAAVLLMTSFTRIIIVFGLLRNALGTPSALPNQMLLGLSLFLTFFIMAPTFNKIYQDAYLPVQSGQNQHGCGDRERRSAAARVYAVSDP